MKNAFTASRIRRRGAYEVNAALVQNLCFEATTIRVLRPVYGMKQITAS
jgi:hypothetical protein